MDKIYKWKAGLLIGKIVLFIIRLRSVAGRHFFVLINCLFFSAIAM